MNMMTLPRMNGSSKGMQHIWLRSSVENFFSTINWEDRPLEVAPEVSASDTELSDQPVVSNGATPLSMTLNVGQFFELFPWEGQRIIAAPVAVEAPVTDEAAVDEITLDDFSDLF